VVVAAVGLVLPVRGIKEKVGAAHSAGIKRVMPPARNRRDFDDIPKLRAARWSSSSSNELKKQWRRRWSRRRRKNPRHRCRSLRTLRRKQSQIDQPKDVEYTT
jgi:predicted S18 family serine protease